MEGEEKFKHSPNHIKELNVMYFSALTHSRKKFQDEVVNFQKATTERLDNVEKTTQSLQLLYVVLLFLVTSILIKTIGSLVW
ncbi:hypothetical protein NIES2098_12840 [Calothrix sp. NIES-2098]|nr:hypothetical protein NIES2098_12840 [Calothrix sp. NIES-2098]